MLDVSVSVVTYHTPRLLVERVVESVRSCELEKRLVIVDNSPEPEYQEMTRRIEWMDYVHNPVNNGYGAAHNIAIRANIDRAKYHLVLNPDVYFGKGTIETIFAYMEKDTSIGHVMPRVTYPDGAVQYLCKLLPTPVDVFVRRFVPSNRVKNRINNRYELRFADFGRSMNVPYLSGCFMLLRTEAIRKVGPFDERFFMYPEDIDLTRRIHQEYKTMYYPAATIVHDHARDSYKSTRMLKAHLFNMVKYFNKWGWWVDRERRIVNQNTLRSVPRQNSHERDAQPTVSQSVGNIFQ